MHVHVCACVIACMHVYEKCTCELHLDITNPGFATVCRMKSVSKILKVS